MGDERFCGTCGAPISQPVAAPVPVAIPPAPPPAAPLAAPPDTHPNRTLVTIAVALLVAVIAATAYFITSGSDDKQATTSTPETTAPLNTSPLASSTTLAPSTTAPSSTLPGGSALRESCTSPDYGFSLKYPAGWYAELSFPGWQCSLFDPSPFTVAPDTEVPPVAVLVSVAEFPFNSSVAQYTDPSYSELVSTNDLTVDGHHAVAVEIMTTQEVLMPVGTMRYAVLVEWGERTLVIETNSALASDYTINKQIVRGMANTLQLPR